MYAYDKSKKDSYADEDFMYDYIISMTTDYANYNTPNTIVVNICNVNVNRDFQKKAYTLLESIFGKEIANYLTYAEAPDEGKPDYTPIYQPFLNKVKAILGEDVDLSEITITMCE